MMDVQHKLELAEIHSGTAQAKKTKHFSALIQMPHRVVIVVSGNQAGKTRNVAQQYWLRVIGIHPIKKKNLLAKKIRCMSSTLPESTNQDEQDNTQYLELKKLIPPEMIVKDITARSQNLVVRRPLGLNSDKTVFEFRSSKQELQDLGKIQLSSVWHDEETPKIQREECKMRLFAEQGDEYFSLTATNPYSYTYNEIWERAELIFRTDTIVEKFGLPQVEHKKENKGSDIAAIQMATDDNPTFDKKTIELLFSDIDPEEIPLRRYGVFKQISGRVFKQYDPKFCYINFQKTFPDGIPYSWMFGRGIDYHESRLPWSVGWIACSPEDEWFVWQEFHPAIDGNNAYNTYEIALAMIRKSMDYYYSVNLIDPLAKKKQANSNFSVVDDLNRFFEEFRKERGIGTQAFWEAWDTKGTAGRDEVGKRFKNAVRCGKPFNNVIREHGMIRRLPTLWICDTCPKFHRSVLSWAYGEYVAASTRATNDPKPEPQQKNSHDCMVLEAFSKDTRLLMSPHFLKNKPSAIMPRRHISVTGR